MFEAQLISDLESIFDLDHGFTLNSVDETAPEQEIGFIEIESSKTRVKDKKFIARVTGKIRVFANSEKLPYGYFSKCIDAANSELRKKFFFFEFEENVSRIQNIVERDVGFVYFFSSQYDPSQGTISSVTIEMEES